LRLLALEEQIDAELGTGRAGALVAQLEALVLEHPARERLLGQLMLALYRTGRQADALETFRRGRAHLDEELGIEPGLALRELEARILRQDPELGAIRGRTAQQRRRRLVPVLVAAAAALLFAATAAVFAVTRDNPEAGLASVSPNSLAEIDPATSAVVAQIPVGIRPTTVSATGTEIWVANADDRTVAHVDARTHELVRSVAVNAVPSAVVASSNGALVATEGGNLDRIDREFHTLDKVTAVESAPGTLGVDPRQLALAYGSVWMTSTVGLVSRIDARTGRVQSTIEVGEGASGIAAGAGSLWVANTSDGTVSRIDRTGDVIATIPVGHGPTGVAFADDAVWVTLGLDGKLVRIDPSTNAPVAAIAVGPSPAGVTAAHGAVWVAVSGDGSVARVDPGTNRVERHIQLSGRPVGIASGGDSVWVTVQRAPEPVGRTGGTAHLTVETDPGTLDPAVTYDPGGYQLLYATCAKLVTYPDAAGPAGSILVPEAAESMPRISDDGRTYTFVVRRGLRFSPPSGRPVTAATFKSSIERVLDPGTKSPVGTFLDDIVGARSFRTGRAEHVVGIAARGRFLTIRLVAPRGDLTARLAMPNFCAVPPNTPVEAEGVAGIPSAGPYYIASFTPGARILLRRNPYYRGDRPRRLAGIELSVGIAKAEGLRAVLDGSSDYALDGVPTVERARIARKYAGRKAGVRAFVNPALTVHYLVLNNSRPPFDGARMRKAANYAIDRAALVAAHRRFFDWGALGGGKVNDQYLPPGMPGYARTPIYRGRPDLKRARSLAGAGNHRQATLIVCNTPPCPQIAAIVKRNLAAIGIDVVVRPMSVSLTYQHAAMAHPDWDLILFGFGADYVDPGTFMNLFAGRGATPGSSPLLGLAQHAPTAKAIARASTLSSPKRTRAFAGLARRLARNTAPAIAFATDESLDLFAPRIGCQTYSPIYGIDLAALCITA
jgi:peptide/nickel transport system substrate-binding protein